MHVNKFISDDELGTLLHLCDETNAKLIAEVGCAYGNTTLELSKKATVWAIDIWKDDDTFLSFLTNTKSALMKSILPVRLPSHSAASLFSNGFFDVVFIDADHAYSQVTRDIRLWLPKVRRGGVLCGHDCEMFYSHYSAQYQQEIDTHCEDERTPFPCHPGVIKALYDIFHDDYERPSGNRIWVKRLPPFTC